jgi:hypothetical protein
MKTGSSKHLQSLSVLCLAVWAAGRSASAQTPPVLDVHLYANAPRAENMEDAVT